MTHGCTCNEGASCACTGKAHGDEACDGTLEFAIEDEHDTLCCDCAEDC